MEKNDASIIVLKENRIIEYKTGTPDPNTVELQLENYRKALKAEKKPLEET